MRYVDLFVNHRALGRHDVPELIQADDGRSFRLFSAILTGGNGVVFEAAEVEGTVPNRRTAVKLLKQLGPARVDRFNNEVRVLRELSSPYISAFTASGSTSVTLQGAEASQREVPWVAMQLGGKNLRQQVGEHGPLSLAQFKSISFGMCASVGHLHEKGFIHRDIKPENFVWRGLPNTAPLMIDFGIAKRQGEDVSARPMDTFTQVTEFVGPVFFSSPELIEYAKDKNHPVDYRSDIFQLGKVFWYLATGKISAGVPSKRECPANGKLRELVLAMIDDDVACRPSTLAEVHAAVTAL